MSNIKITEEPIGKPPIRFPCRMEFNKFGIKLVVSYDGDDYDDALARIDEGFAIMEYGQNAFMMYIDKLASHKEKK